MKSYIIDTETSRYKSEQHNVKKENLHNIKNTGFKTPENYFETFEAELLDCLSQKEAIGIEKTGYKIPENYFETLETRVLQNIEAQSETKVVKLRPKRTLFYVAGFAASIVLLISILYTNRNNISFDNLDTVAIESYLYQEEYSNEDLAALFQSVDISETDFINFEISEETLDQYLDTIETEDLILD
ncbi:hypothetical protein [Winogradskyella ursingii]|uniref:hypothetical protein n=1 Tax=Winogradskyella ursingii TaxID=2686079 RepID=UPI0015CC213C|nr:hypothetical protein [Winogradskyella ursingii]